MSNFVSEEIIEQPIASEVEKDIVINNSSDGLYVLACAHEEMNPKRRNTMEDVHRIVPNLIQPPNKGNYLLYQLFYLFF
jgi:hypothetical protein